MAPSHFKAGYLECTISFVKRSTKYLLTNLEEQHTLFDQIKHSKNDESFRDIALLVNYIIVLLTFMSALLQMD